MTDSTTTAFKVEVEIDLANYLHDWADEGRPVTIEQLVIDQAARQVAAKAIADADQYPTIKERANKLLAAMVEARVEAAVSTALTEARQPTNQWGQPKGDPVTLEETIDAKVAQLLQSSVATSDRRGTTTYVERAISDEVRTTVAKVVKAAVAAERDAVVAKVTAASAAVLTEGLRRAVTL